MPKQNNVIILKFEKLLVSLPEDQYSNDLQHIKLGFNDPLSGQFRDNDFIQGYKVFDRVDYHYKDFREIIKTETYFVNHDDARLALPVIDVLIDIKTKEIRRDLDHEIEAHKRVVKKLAELEKIEKLFIVKLYKKLLNLFRK
jgi:hypothetical protein